MNPTSLLKRARRCHKSAAAIKAHAASARVAAPEDAMHELKIAESLEALAAGLERQAISPPPKHRDGPP
jgi:hypothetical protein